MLFEKINKAVNALEVYDINGKPIMRKDIFQGKNIGVSFNESWNTHSEFSSQEGHT